MLGKYAAAEVLSVKVMLLGKLQAPQIAAALFKIAIKPFSVFGLQTFAYCVNKVCIL